MRINENEDITPIDVDETLVLRGYHPLLSTVDIPDPLCPGQFIKLRVHEPMIRLLREQHSRGSHIIVWSRGGYKWAAAVVKALGIEDYVHEVMSKPKTYFDDLPVENWLKDRVYLEPDCNYKKSVL